VNVTAFRGHVRRSAVLALVSVTAASALALGSLAFGGGAVARADTGGTPFEVGAFGCLAAFGGHRTVPAGSMIVIRNGWISTVFGSQRSFLDAQTSILSVNDGPMADVSDAYTEPERAPDGRWVTWLRHPTGVTLANAGDSMRFTFALVFDRPVTDTSDLDGDGSIDPVGQGQPGLAFGGTCTVTAG
jgi:hypothetical protein